MRLVAGLWIAALTACGACGDRSSPATPTSAPAPASTAVTPPRAGAPDVTCYEGELATVTGFGSLAHHTLLRRTYARSRATILERWSTELGWVEDDDVEMLVTGDRFIEVGAWTGEGKLVGEPWAWRAWTAESHSGAGVHRTLDATLTASGLTVSEIMPSVSIRGTLVAFDCAHYAERRSALGGADPRDALGSAR